MQTVETEPIKLNGLIRGSRNGHNCEIDVYQDETSEIIFRTQVDGDLELENIPVNIMILPNQTYRAQEIPVQPRKCTPHLDPENTSGTEFEGSVASLNLKASNIPAETECIEVCTILSGMPSAFSGSVNLSIGGFDIELHGRRGASRCICTCKGATLSQVDKVRDTVQNVCWLASFATGSLIGIPRLEVYHNDRPVVIELKKSQYEYSQKRQWSHI